MYLLLATITSFMKICNVVHFVQKQEFILTTEPVTFSFVAQYIIMYVFNYLRPDFIYRYLERL